MASIVILGFTKKKWFWILIILAIIIGLGFWEVFPDPYYHQGTVNFYVWFYREIDELLHGEKA